MLPTGPTITPQPQRAAAPERGGRAAVPTGIRVPRWGEKPEDGEQGCCWGGGCPQAWEPPAAAEEHGGSAGGCTYRWVRAASGRIARGRPPGRGAGRGRRRPSPAGRTPGAAGHSPGSGDTMLLRGQENTGQEEERGQALPRLRPWPLGVGPSCPGLLLRQRTVPMCLTGAAPRLCFAVAKPLQTAIKHGL